MPEDISLPSLTAAAEPEALARTLSRVLYPDDTTVAGKELRLKQEFFLTSAALQDILQRYRNAHADLRALPDKVAIQLNDTHPAIAGPELIRLLVEGHGVGFDDAVGLAQGVLGYTNHTLLPEALERWSTCLMGTVLPRHMQIILQTIAQWQRLRDRQTTDAVPRLRLFAGKAAPGYGAAKQIIRLIHDAGAVINADPVTQGLLRVVYPANYNVSMAERLIPAADLSEQISTAGMEAAGTGNMKFALNGALTIGTLDGANVEIRDHVGAGNFFLFGLSADEVAARRGLPGQARAAIEASADLQRVLKALAEGRFSPGEPGRYRDLVERIWNHDWFLVAADFTAYDAAQARVDAAWRDPAGWTRMAVLNTARMGFFSSDRAIRGYMSDIWSVESALAQVGNG